MPSARRSRGAIDLAEVNGRVFVNNVSLGVYGEITQSEEYRDAKVATTLDKLPTLLGPGGEPTDLGWTGPDGVHHDSAHLIQVSNNRYSLRAGAGSGTRDRLDDGELGILAVEVSGTAAAVELAALVALRRPDGARALEAWTASTFEVTSGEPIAAGVDGEALQLESPLLFRILPGALRVRLPQRALGYAPAAIAGQSAATTLGNVWRVAQVTRRVLPPSETELACARYQAVTTTAIATELPSAQPATTSESQWTASTSRLTPTSAAKSSPAATSDVLDHR